MLVTSQGGSDLRAGHVGAVSHAGRGQSWPELSIWEVKRVEKREVSCVPRQRELDS